MRTQLDQSHHHQPRTDSADPLTPADATEISEWEQGPGELILRRINWTIGTIAGLTITVTATQASQGNIFAPETILTNDDDSDGRKLEPLEARQLGYNLALAADLTDRIRRNINNRQRS